jgi:hypothetical protein
MVDARETGRVRFEAEDWLRREAFEGMVLRGARADAVVGTGGGDGSGFGRV